MPACHFTGCRVYIGSGCSGWSKHVAMQWKRSPAQPCLFFSILLSFFSSQGQHKVTATQSHASIGLTIATTPMENAFEIGEGSIKDGRVWRGNTEGSR